MAAKNETEVVIGGKTFVLCGYESADYIQRVAIYLNSKMSDYEKIESYQRLTNDYKNLLVELNIVDELFKSKTKIADLEAELEGKEREIYDLKHELIAGQIRLDNADKEKRRLQSEIHEDAKKIARLEVQAGKQG